MEDDSSTSDEIVDVTPRKSNQSSDSPESQLLMPTMPDLNELTCRRSTREKRSPDFYNPSATSTSYLSFGGPDEDYWQRMETDDPTIIKWVRHHNIKRDKLFTPYKTTGGPDTSRLQSHRDTLIKSTDGTTEKLFDDWTAREHGNRTLEKSWTGSTTFLESIPKNS